MVNGSRLQIHTEQQLNFIPKLGNSIRFGSGLIWFQFRFVHIILRYFIFINNHYFHSSSVVVSKMPSFSKLFGKKKIFRFLFSGWILCAYTALVSASYLSAMALLHPAPWKINCDMQNAECRMPNKATAKRSKEPKTPFRLFSFFDSFHFHDSPCISLPVSC